MSNEYCKGVKLSNQCKRCECVTTSTEILLPCGRYQHMILLRYLLDLDDQVLSELEKGRKDSMHKILKDCQQQWAVEDSNWLDNAMLRRH